MFFQCVFYFISEAAFCAERKVVIILVPFSLIAHQRLLRAMLHDGPQVPYCKKFLGPVVRREPSRLADVDVLSMKKEPR